MRPARAKAILLVCVLAANLAFAGGPGARGAYACSYVGDQTPAEELESSDAVFAGEVMSLGAEDSDPEDDVPLGGAKFSIKASWKGISGDSAIIYGFGATEGGGMLVETSCDVTFERGDSYLVYAYREEEEGDEILYTDICTATKPLSDAEEDLRVLSSPSSTLPDTGGVPLPGLGAAALAVTSLILAGALIARRGGDRDR